MENNSFEFLQKNLRYLGFGSSLNAALKAKISEQLEQFKIGVSADFTNLNKQGAMLKDRVNYELSFSKSTKSNNYFLNSLKVTLNDEFQQTFSFGQGNDVTAKEAYNLLRGAAIMKKVVLTNQIEYSGIELKKDEKEVEPEPPKRIEQIWVKLDLDNQKEQGNYSFKKFYQNHGFNLESELDKYPIKQLKNEKERNVLIASLGRGNTEKIFLESGETVLIEVDPENKKIQFYDMDFRELSVPSLDEPEMNR